MYYLSSLTQVKECSELPPRMDTWYNDEGWCENYSIYVCKDIEKAQAVQAALKIGFEKGLLAEKYRIRTILGLG